MMNPPTIINSKEQEIINASVDSDPKDIARELGISISEVFDVLSKPEAQRIRDIKVREVNARVQFKRLSKASTLIDKLMDGIEKLVSLNPEKWKMQHVISFKMLLESIPEQIKNIQQVNNFNQVNINQDEARVESSLEEKMSKLPASLKMEFWADVEKLAEDYVKRYGDEKIQNNSGFVDGSVLESD